LIMMN